jgi:N-acetyl-alpha-D-muramate 1-phosphate uridylyltransferase
MNTAMLLAAGRGDRLRPLTDKLPKALVPVHDKPLIDYHLERLQAAGITRVVINLAHLGEQIQAHCGDGSHYGLQIQYSPEPEGGYETGGGVKHALPLLQQDRFLVVNADVYTDYPFAQLCQQDSDCYLVLVSNPPHNLDGDYACVDGQIHLDGHEKFTYSGIGIFSADVFKHDPRDYFRTPEVLVNRIEQGQVHGEVYGGQWHDVGTIDRWQALNERDV